MKTNNVLNANKDGYYVAYSKDDNYFGNYDDEQLQEIKNICFGYLDDKSAVDKIDNDTMMEHFEFLTEKYIEIKNVKRALNLDYYALPFMEIERGMERFTLTGTIKGNVKQSTEFTLMKDITGLLENVGYCYGIINIILRERGILTEY